MFSFFSKLSYKVDTKIKTLVWLSMDVEETFKTKYIINRGG